MGGFKNLNKLLGKFDFSIKDLTSFENHIENTLRNFPASKLRIEKGRAVYRFRKYTLPVTSFYRFESELSYRTDLHNINSFGRCNIPNNSVFYGSMHHFPIQSEMDNLPFLTALFETSAIIGSSKNEGVEVYGVGVWEARDELEVVIVPPDSTFKSKSDLANELLTVHEKHIEKAQINGDVCEFYEILGREFSKSMAERPNSEYGISALFSTHSVHTGGGIAYCSVKADHEGFNIALSPQILDKCFDFKRAGVGELWKIGSKNYFKFVATAERDQGIPLKYKPTNNNSTEDVFEHFRNHGIDSKRIAKMLASNLYQQ